MVLSLGVFILTCLLLILCILFKPSIKIKNIELQTFWIVCLIGALLILLTGTLPINFLFQKITENSAVNPLKILILFVSMSMLSITLDVLGFFKFLASKVANIFNSSQYKLFFALYLLISLLTIFTSNDIIILTFTPFICYFAKNAKINPIPYLVMEFVVANTYSMLLPIGNPTNIYLSQSFYINFLDYLKVMLLPTFLAGITSIGTLLLIFKKQLKQKMDVTSVEVWHISNRLLTTISLTTLGACTILLVIANYINIEMWSICFVSALILTIAIVIFSKNKKRMDTLKAVYKRLPYNLIFFVLSMYTLILSLNYTGLTANISNQVNSISSNNFTSAFVYGISSTIMCNLINNIPMSIFYSSIITTSSPTIAVYATIIGSNLGAYLTPIGALAGIMWMSILKKQNIHYSFKDFTKYGLILVPSILIASLLGLLITI